MTIQAVISGSSTIDLPTFSRGGTWTHLQIEFVKIAATELQEKG